MSTKLPGKADYDFREAVKVFIYRQSRFAQTVAWWNYRHYNTVKPLICETPQGVVAEGLLTKSIAIFS